jgi:UDPglucose 6-dehydrogenase
MKIGIMGLGVIGSACKYGFEKLGHDVSFHDTAMETKIEDVLDTEIVYVCVPTPSAEDGSCDTRIVEKVVKELWGLEYKGIIAIKSTVEPGFTQALMDQAWKHTHPTKTDKIGSVFYSDRPDGNMVCFVPEFLRERCAITDFTENHDLLVVGTNDSLVYNTILSCHGKYPKETQMLSPTEAELIKYYSNAYNAMRVVFANEMYEICDSLGADYQAIKDTFVKRGTVKDLYLDVNDNFRGYGGPCLPKDTAALAALVNKLGLDLDLFDCIERENKKFKTTVPEGMRL